MLDIDCHCEADGLTDVFMVTSRDERTVIHGLSFKDHQPAASRSILNSDHGINKIAINDCQMNISNILSHSCNFLAAPLKWTLSGFYCSSNARGWNGASRMTGFQLIGGSFQLIGISAVTVQSGDVQQRPRDLGAGDIGRLFFDTELSKLLTWTGTNWV